MEKIKKYGWAITFIMLLITIGSGLVWIGEKANHLDEVTFDDSKQKHEVIEFTSTEVNEVTVFRQGDTLKKQQRILEQLILKQNTMLDSISRLRIKKIIQDSIREIKKDISRDSRESKMDKILELLKKQDSINSIKD